MSEIVRLSRRAFLKDMGRGTLAVAILGVGVVACSSDSEGSTSAPTTAGGPGTSTTGGSGTSTTRGDGTSTTTTEAETPPAATGAVSWERVILGNVSAYLLARGTEVAIVDTGNPGSAPVIEQSLSTIGLGWSNVGHVILTHLHADHIGSLGPVMDSASVADGYAGEADISAMSASPRPIIAIGDDDQVFGLDIIETPGHTAGHISVLDSVGGLLVAGDALFGEGGGVVGSLPDFTADLTQADVSVKKIAGFQFETVVFGHGDPIVGGADAAVASLAASL